MLRQFGDPQIASSNWDAKGIWKARESSGHFWDVGGREVAFCCLFLPGRRKEGRIHAAGTVCVRVGGGLSER